LASNPAWREARAWDLQQITMSRSPCMLCLPTGWISASQARSSSAPCLMPTVVQYQRRRPHRRNPAAAQGRDRCARAVTLERHCVLPSIDAQSARFRLSRARRPACEHHTRAGQPSLQAAHAGVFVFQRRVVPFASRHEKQRSGLERHRRKPAHLEQPNAPRAGPALAGFTQLCP
jgi:hypothetical protein